MVYVDPMFPCAPNPNWRWTESCHMYADTLEELHAAAAHIGLKRAWFQDRMDLPHYDLTRARRAAAVKANVQETDHRHMVGMMKKNREARLKGSDGTHPPERVGTLPR